MKLTDIVIQRIITKILQSRDYRKEILTIIDASFLNYCIDFFGRIAQAKLNNAEIDTDWYRREFITKEGLKIDDVIIQSGLNKKTISNSYGSSSRKTVLEVTPKYYDGLHQVIRELTTNNDNIDITLTIKLRGVSVDLNISESLIIINTIAVKRAELRGGAWSTLGKSVEKKLMLTLCLLFDIDSNNYALTGQSEQGREIDFFLISRDGIRYRCEVKLMGKGNPESADAFIARDSHIFIADTLSELNRTQLTSRSVYWVQLQSPGGYQKFYDILFALDIPAQNFSGDLETALEDIFKILF